MQKRIIMFLFAVCLTFSLCACAGESGKIQDGADANVGSAQGSSGAGANGTVTSSTDAKEGTDEPTDEATNENTKKLTEFESLFKNGPIPARDTSGLWGYIDSDGEWVIPPTYADARDFWDSGCAAVAEAGWGLIDSSGTYVVEPELSYIPSRPSEGFLRVSDSEYRWGYIDLSSGEYLVKPKYEEAYDFSEGLACVSLGYSYGYIDKSGEFVIDPVYSEANPFSDGLACVKLGSLYGYIDKSGEFVIEPSYSEATPFSDGVAFVSMGAHYGMIGKDGNAITGPICGMLPWYNVYFNYGLYPIMTADMSGYVYINKEGEIVLPKDGQPYYAADMFSGGLAAVCYGNQLYGYIDVDGNWVVPPKYDQFGSGNSSGDYICVTDGPYNELIFDSSGNCVLEFGEDLRVVNWLRHERIAVRETASDKIGFWDICGNVVIDYQFDMAGHFAFDYSYAKVAYDGLWGMIDKDGNWLIPAKFSSLGLY